MNDEEIKEILNNPKILMLSYGNYISLGDYFKLKDYITNLQDQVKGIREERNYLFNKLSTENKYLQEENEKLKNRIHALEKHNKKLQLEAQKYFDLLMECEHGGDKE